MPLPIQNTSQILNENNIFGYYFRLKSTFVCKFIIWNKQRVSSSSLRLDEIDRTCSSSKFT